MANVSAERWQRIEDAFGRVAEAPPEARDRLLDETCAGDAALRREIESLLATEVGARSALQRTISGAVFDLARAAAEALIGTRIGAYRIVRLLGEGGAGTVYLATRDDAEYTANVAIKVLHRAGTQAIARFRDEVQILAELAHPGIVRLRDSGRTDAGLPYLVMDHVEGVPLGEHCKRDAPSIERRLELFQQVCAAVQHAHQNLVVHRDLKPSNILVDAHARAHLLDFGIAKLLDEHRASEARTRPGTSNLTPEYASPEQARGEHVTTATDVYSLGAVLYYLLAEVPPLPATDDPLEQLRRLCEDVPPRPSSLAPAPRRARIEGDLDNIVMKALEKEPQRRYASVEQLADDVARHLAGLPVNARPATFRYRAGKFVRRHRGKVAASTVAVLALAASTFVSVVLAARVSEHATRAERRFNDVRKLAHSLVFGIDEEIRTLRGSTAARELVVAGALEYLDRLASEAEDDAALARELALTYMKIGDIQGDQLAANLGRPADGLVSYAKARAILDRLPRGEPATRSAEVAWLHGHALMEHAAGNSPRAREGLARARAALAELSAEEVDLPLMMRGYVLATDLAFGAGEVPEARRLVEEGLQAARVWRARSSEREARYWSSVMLTGRARILGHLGDPHAAVAGCEEALGEMAKLAEEYPHDARFSRELFYIHWLAAGFLGGVGDSWSWTAATGDLARAERELRAALDALLRSSSCDRDAGADARHGPEHALALTVLAAIVAKQDAVRARPELAAAAAAWRAVPAATRELPYSVQLEWYLHCMLGDHLASTGDAAGAAASADEAMRVLARDRAGAFVDERTQCTFLLARARHSLGDDTAATTMTDTVIATLEPRLAKGSFEIANYIALDDTLALQASMRPREACALRARQRAVWRAWPGPVSPFVRDRIARIPACP